MLKFFGKHLFLQSYRLENINHCNVITQAYGKSACQRSFTRLQFEVLRAKAFRVFALPLSETCMPQSYADYGTKVKHFFSKHLLTLAILHVIITYQICKGTNFQHTSIALHELSVSLCI